MDTRSIKTIILSLHHLVKHESISNDVKLHILSSLGSNLLLTLKVTRFGLAIDVTNDFVRE